MLGRSADVQDGNTKRGVRRRASWWWFCWWGDGRGDTSRESEGRSLNGHSQSEKSERIPHFDLESVR
jgi:hypothetical protein